MSWISQFFFSEEVCTFFKVLLAADFHGGWRAATCWVRTLPLGRPLKASVLLCCILTSVFYAFPNWSCICFPRVAGTEVAELTTRNQDNRLYTYLAAFLDRLLVFLLFWNKTLLAQGWRETGWRSNKKGLLEESSGWGGHQSTAVANRWFKTSSLKKDWDMWKICFSICTLQKGRGGEVQTP